MASEKKDNNLMIVISGPSGVGKSTIVRRLLAHADVADTLEASVSATTREPRPGEIDGVDYNFMSRDEFEKLKSSGELMEWANVHGELYGTPRNNRAKALAAGKDLVLEIDVEGAMQVRGKYSDAVMIFINAPLDVIRARIEGRPSNLEGEEHRKLIALRMKNALEEIAMIPKYDHVVINETIDECAEMIISIIKVQRGAAGARVR